MNKSATRKLSIATIKPSSRRLLPGVPREDCRRAALLSGSFGTPVQRVDSGSATGGGTRCGAEGLGGGLSRERSFRWGRWRYLRSACLWQSAGLRLLFDAHETLVRDFPTEMF